MGNRSRVDQFPAFSHPRLSFGGIGRGGTGTPDFWCTPAENSGFQRGGGGCGQPLSSAAQSGCHSSGRRWVLGSGSWAIAGQARPCRSPGWQRCPVRLFGPAGARVDIACRLCPASPVPTHVAIHPHGRHEAVARDTPDWARGLHKAGQPGGGLDRVHNLQQLRQFLLLLWSALPVCDWGVGA